MIRYRTILIDPPWMETGAGKIHRGADRHYPLMKTDEIIETIRDAEIFRPDSSCHLYLWTTNRFLPDGLRVLDELGFRYVTNLVWTKDRYGLGQFFRGQHELCLFAVKGKHLAYRARDVPSVIRGKRRRHSAKPAKIYDVAERVSYPPRLEMFARDHREGWDAWGIDVPDEIQTTLRKSD